MTNLSRVQRLLAPAIVFLVVGAAACGGGGSGYSTSPGTTYGSTPPASSGNTISVAYAYFDPSSVTIPVNGSVSWVFSGLLHNIVFSGTGAPAPIPNTSSGSVSRTFNTKGTFTMTCTIHSGMTGTITVQ